MFIRKPAITVYYDDLTGYLFVPQAFSAKNGTRIDIDPVVKASSEAQGSELGMNILSTMAISEKLLKIPEPNSNFDVLRKVTGIKNEKSFSKVYRCITITKGEEYYELVELVRDHKYGVHMGSITQKTFEVELSSPLGELGEAVLTCLAHGEGKSEDIIGHEFDLFSGKKLCYKEPPDEFINIGDAGTDAYQVYVYDYDGKETYFGFIYGSKYKKMDKASVKKLWQKYYGDLIGFEFTPIDHKVFKYFAKAETKTRLIKAYFFQDDDIWCDFTLVIDTSNLSSSQIEHIVAEYDSIKDSCYIR